MSDHIIHLEDGRLADDTGAAHVEKSVQVACAASGIAIHFHGGLVNYSLGLDIATRLAPRYLAAGAYPLFFVWEAGLVEVVQNRLHSIAQESIFQELWERLAEFAMRKLDQTKGARAAGALPPLRDPEPSRSIQLALNAERSERLLQPNDLRRATPLTQPEEQQLQSELEVDVRLAAQLRALTPADPAGGTRGPTPLGAATPTLMDPGVLAQLRSGGGPGTRAGLLSSAKLAARALDALRRVLVRFWSGRDHGFHATIVEELLRAFYLASVGKAAWELIKSNTASAFGGTASSHGGTALVDGLRRNLNGRTPRITLIGHSTGAIYISELLDRAVPALPASVNFEIVLLAAASTHVRTADTLQRHASRISAFRSFAMTDANERADELVPVIYPHSLLYFVSGVLENEPDAPIVGMERYFNGPQYDGATFPSVAALRTYLAPAGRGVWSVANVLDGQRSASLSHGNFDNDEATLSSVGYILSRGF